MANKERKKVQIVILKVKKRYDERRNREINVYF